MTIGNIMIIRTPCLAPERGDPDALLFSGPSPDALARDQGVALHSLTRAVHGGSDLKLWLRRGFCSAVAHMMTTDRQPYGTACIAAVSPIVSRCLTRSFDFFRCI